MVPDGGIEALTASMLQRESAYASENEAKCRRDLKDALQTVVDWVVHKEQLFAPREEGNREWFTYALQEETSMAVQSFFAFGVQPFRRCPKHGTEYEEPALTIFLDVSPPRDGAADFAQAFSHFFRERSRGSCPQCGERLTLGRTVVSTPAVLFVDLVEQETDLQFFELKTKVTLGGRAYALSGRICALEAGGYHFTAIARHAASAYSPHREGVYLYDDQDGRAMFRPDSSHAELTRPRKHAILAVYVAEEGGSQLGVVHDHIPVAEPKAKKRSSRRLFQVPASSTWMKGAHSDHSKSKQSLKFWDVSAGRSPQMPDALAGFRFARGRDGQLQTQRTDYPARKRLRSTISSQRTVSLDMAQTDWRPHHRRASATQ
ncbi:hypothetical protein OC844_007886, partial [Tilletia horrida]